MPYYLSSHLILKFRIVESADLINDASKIYGVHRVKYFIHVSPCLFILGHWYLNNKGSIVSKPLAKESKASTICYYQCQPSKNHSPFYDVKGNWDYDSGILFVGNVLGNSEIFSQSEPQVWVPTFPSTDKPKSF